MTPDLRSSPIRILIVDDHPVVLAGLTSMLSTQPDFDVVGSASGGEEALQMLRGELTLKEAIFYAQRNTRRYAKRQMTWLRQEAGMMWLKGFGDSPDIRGAAWNIVNGYFTVRNWNSPEPF